MIEFDCEKYDRERQNSSLDQNQEDEF
jgi:hypothetical protein